MRSSIALALGWAYRFSGDLVAASKALGEARTIGLMSGNIYLAVAATCRAAHGLVLGGKLHQAVESYQEAVQMTTRKDGRHLPVAGYAYVYLGGVYREWNDLETATRYLVEGIDLCTQVGYRPGLFVAFDVRLWYTLSYPPVKAFQRRSPYDGESLK